MSDIRKIFDSMEYGPAPEDAARARQWIAERDATFGHWINGAWTGASHHFESVNPANQETLAMIGQAGSSDVDAAVSVARQALGPWQALGGEGRARHLYALARQVQKHARILSVIETLDNGKPIRETRDIDIPLVARHFYHHAGWATIVDEELPNSEPLGVIGQIIPWNFPLLMLAWKVAPALAAGNTVVLKPAEYTSLSALYFAQMSHDAGLPPGVLNIVTGDGNAGRELVEHSGINKVAFTGSTSVGREIRQATAGSGKALTLELGGKSPFIVFADADLDSAVEGVVDAIWFNQGQVCCAGSRLLVQESVADDFLGRLKTRMRSLRLGDPLDKAIDMGAIVDQGQLETIRSYVEGAAKEGASCWQAGSGVPNQGWYFPPTLVTDVAPAHTIATEEVFGPVLAVMTFRTHNEAIEIANNTRYGLAASVWSENVNLALEIASKVKAGVIWVNCTNEFDAAVGFGGYRESGFGREGGIEGLWAYRRSPLDLTPDENPSADPALPQLPAEGSALDRTAKLYIGGRQVRPDSGYSRPVAAMDRSLAGEVGEGNRKDIRNAVEAAHSAAAWGRGSAHGRAQVMYFLAENLESRADEFAKRIKELTGTDGEHEVTVAISRLLYYAGWCDKFEGVTHNAPGGRIVFALPEPIGVMGLICPQSHPLVGLVSLMAPAIAVGNAVVVIPSANAPLVATDFYQVLETSDVPAGVVNFITGSRPELAKELARHDNVDGLWCAGHHEMAMEVERFSSGNLKQTWVFSGERDWCDPNLSQGRPFLRRATQVKNIWVPYGE